MSDYEEYKDITCTREETLRRIGFCCGPCEHNILKDNIPICEKCSCSISLITTVTFKSCPIGKW